MAAQGERTLIAGGAVWTGAGFGPADILVDGDRIEALLAPGQAGEGAFETVDAAGCAVLPPFFDGHVHSSATLARGTENSMPLELWSFWAIGYGAGASAATIGAAVRLAAVEMIRAGIGGYVDHFPPTRFMETALAAHRESGLRIGFAPFFADLLDEDLLEMKLDRAVIARHAQAGRTTEAALAAQIEALAGLSAPRITPLLGPNAPQRCSDRLLDLWSAAARRHGFGSHTHLLETFPQRQAARARWPGGAVFELDRRGLLDGGVSLAHAIWLEPAARDLLAERGATAIHNPISNQMLGSGAMPVRAMLDAGVRLGLGTDCSNTAGRHDLFETMRQMLVSGRDPGGRHADWIRPEEALVAATEAGWAALGAGPAGLARGAAADLLLLDFRSATLAAAPVTAASVVSHGDPRAVRSLMVGGDWLLRDGVVTVMDEAAVIADAARHAADIRAAAAEGRAALEALIGDYDAWSAAAFRGRACPHCGATHAPLRPEDYAEGG